MFWQAVEDMPNMLHASMKNMYPYYMGMRLDNYLRNLTQPYMLTAGELNSTLSGSYGPKLAIQATADSVTMQLAAREIDFAENFLKARGALSERSRFEAIDFLKDGFEEAILELDTKWGRAKKMTREALDAASRFSMYMYTKSDIQNRFVTVNMARRFTSDLVEGNAKALQAVKENFPVSYRRQIEKAMAAGDNETLNQTIETYLLSKTQFNYDKVSLSEYGRYMGGMFSMFSKWPSSILGEIGLGVRQSGGKDIIEQIENASKGLVSPKSMAKWWGPLMSMLALEAVIPDGDKSNIRRMVLGRSDLYNWTPIKSIGDFDITTPPIVDVATKIGRGVISGGFLENLSKGNTWRAAEPFAPVVPGSVFARFMFKDIPIYQGEK
jgi:hypothetical protein